MKHEPTPAQRRRSDLRWGVGFLIGGVVLALIGEPQPVAIFVAGASALTGAYLLFRPGTRR